MEETDIKAETVTETPKFTHEKFWNSIFALIWKSIFNIFAITGLYGLFWRPVYWFLGKLHRNGTAKFRFMNYGFVAVTERDKSLLKFNQNLLQLEPKQDQNNIRLYERTLALLPDYPKGFENCDFLEISCGHGGGIEWILKTYPMLKSVKGMDATIVDTMNEQILQGLATDIPLQNDTVDLILNVESSHCYGDQPRFLQECFRILRPGGYLLWADLRPIGLYCDLWHSDPLQVGFERVGNVEIWNEQVIRSLDEQKEKYMEKFEQVWYTRWFRLFWAAFWGTPGTGMYRSLEQKTFLYMAVALRKPLALQSAQ